MRKAKFEMTGEVKVEFEHTEGEVNSKVEAISFLLEPGKNLDKRKYLDAEDIPNADGTHALANLFVMGLAGCIQLASEKGWRIKGEYLEQAIEKLRKAVEQQAKVSKGTM